MELREVEGLVEAVGEIAKDGRDHTEDAWSRLVADQVALQREEMTLRREDGARQVRVAEMHLQRLQLELLSRKEMLQQVLQVVAPVLMVGAQWLNNLVGGKKNQPPSAATTETPAGASAPPTPTTATVETPGASEDMIEGWSTLLADILTRAKPATRALMRAWVVAPDDASFARAMDALRDDLGEKLTADFVHYTLAVRGSSEAP